MRRALAASLLVPAAQPAVGSVLRSHASAGAAEVPKFPPDPALAEMPAKSKDGAFGSKTAACGACKYASTGSCAMYKTCICYATNSHFEVMGVPEPTDTNNWHWACDNEGGEKYEQCFNPDSKYQDTFGDKVDPNKPKCA